ncbi:MAG: S9 family peptidase [Pyrinomonadaceae bacterium]|nr:S9 family peptidase [Pyrinomonadaceae bacterium]
MKKLTVLFSILLFSVVVSAQPYTIQQYLNIKSAGSPSFSPDAKQLIYLSNTTGTTQVWKVDLPAGKPVQLTNYEDNIGFARWLPDGSGIVFGKARGGDENTQFYWMKPNGSGVRSLTDEPSVRHNFGLISDDGDVIAYASNKRNRQFFDIYAMDIASGKEVLLFQHDGNNSVIALSDNGRQIIVSRDRIEKSLDNDLFLIDVRTKNEILLTPHTDASEFGDAEFLADSILMTSNNGREFSALTQLRQKNASGDDWSEANRSIEIVDGPSWDVGGITLNSNDSIMAYTVNNNGFSELFLRKIETGGKPLISTVDKQAVEVKLPAQGIVGGTAFSKDGSKLAFSFSSSTQNGDVWVYDLRSKRLAQVTQSDQAGIDPKTFVAPELIKFKSFDGREIPAWYYKPKGASDVKVASKETQASKSVSVTKPPRAPVIVSVHGGPEGQSRPGFNALFQYYLSRGYAILDPNVRGSTGYGKTYTHLDDVEKREDSVKDLAAAHEWLKRSGSDPKRIAVIGGSYGGYMTMAAITLYPDLWAAAVGTVAITNWETFLTNTSSYRRRQREVEYGRLDKDIEFLRRISPIRKIDRIKTPLFVISGRNDPRVPYTEGEQMVDALRKRGAVVQYKLYDDEGHGISKLKNRLDLYPLVADFLDKYMK